MAKLLLLCLLIISNHSAFASENYRITLLRATPGGLSQLIDSTKQYKSIQQDRVSIMRHSQGDHWDILLLEPAGDSPLTHRDFGAIVDFQHTFLAQSNTDWHSLTNLESKSDLFHIEMFHAKNGKTQELLKQRAMENDYLTLTQRAPNIIFETLFGSDVDSFTIGYYTDMPAFASMPDLASEVFSKAALKAGFKSRDDIGLYLRELIVSHHDTLATKVN
ncbi:MAG: hypothetical protein KUG78_15945 [Kangiellaceae bacterium]|nr:hypothetical protein [Kangiellaceae bacterium]